MVVPALWGQDTFVSRSGAAVLDQMYAFEDKRGRPICLIPEVTAIVRERWREAWQKRRGAPLKLFYVARCYRYERPQSGRYREFTQVGVEVLGGDNAEQGSRVRDDLSTVLDAVGVVYRVCEAVPRGAAYYTGPGFEVECDVLGAQKQVAGGGAYPEGVGWALGVERLLLALERQGAS